MTQRDVPTRVGMDTDWAMVDGGGQFAAAVKTDGTLWAWGQNHLYQLGQGDLTERLVPTQIGADADWAWVGLLRQRQQGAQDAPAASGRGATTTSVSSASGTP